jgi:hypothetical protein
LIRVYLFPRKFDSRVAILVYVKKSELLDRYLR